MHQYQSLSNAFDAATQGTWSVLGKYHNVAFGHSASDDALGHVFGCGPLAEANVNFICQVQNRMPDILADLRRLEKLDQFQNRSGMDLTLATDLHALKEAFTRSTQGNWEVCHHGYFVLDKSDSNENEIVQVMNKGAAFTIAEAEANLTFIALAHTIFPSLLAEIERLQWLEAELQRVRERANLLESALDQSESVMQEMREQIEQMRGLFNDEDGAIQACCDEYEDVSTIICQALKQ